MVFEYSNPSRLAHQVSVSSENCTVVKYIGK